MLDYNLDQLGWFEFEKLVQALLKIRLGLGVEAWGGRGDWGRDAYFEGPLEYPVTSQGQGPFLFQCKFVEAANAAGSETEGAVLNGVAKEVDNIRRRQSSFKRWPVPPKHYTLFTNAPANAPLRKKIIAKLRSVLLTSDIHIHDGKDLCIWLRTAPEVVRGFPQILSLRDIQTLLKDCLRECVHADTFSRSEIAISLAKEQARVFVPTQAYYEARDRLQKHGFVVLEGPPEMGKTTIGRIIALSQICSGWEALECRLPSEVLGGYQRDRKQVFVADDFFGRTEYSPMRVSEWEAELAHILPMLDATHWLILTSRAHLLEMAKSRLDISGNNERFPEIGEVVVDAGKLSASEKARILYRHSKASQLNSARKEIIKSHARTIIDNRHFTPERVRRFIYQLATKPPVAGQEGMAQFLHEALTDPTKQMRVSFKALPSSHRWLLYALLDLDDVYQIGSSKKALESGYNQLCPSSEHQAYRTVLDELSNAFVRKTPTLFDEGIQWVHPSCRDLAIDELAGNKRERKQFLLHCNQPGLLLATSVAGGAKGERVLPLIQNDTDWGYFTKRAEELTAIKPRFIGALWENCRILSDEAAKLSILRANGVRFHSFIKESLLTEVSKSLSVEDRAFDDSGAMQAYLEICASMKIKAKLKLDGSWQTCQEHAEEWAQRDLAIWEKHEGLDQIGKFVGIIQKYLPREFDSAIKDGVVSNILDPIVEVGEGEQGTWYMHSDQSVKERADIAEGYEALAKALSRLIEIPDLPAKQCAQLESSASHFESEASSIREGIPSPDSDSAGDGYTPGTSDDVPVDELFRDL